MKGARRREALVLLLDMGGLIIQEKKSGDRQPGSLILRSIDDLLNALETVRQEFTQTVFPRKRNGKKRIKREEGRGGLQFRKKAE